jgi:hypothetical protein
MSATPHDPATRNKNCDIWSHNSEEFMVGTAGKAQQALNLVNWDISVINKTNIFSNRDWMAKKETQWRLFDKTDM